MDDADGPVEKDEKKVEKEAAEVVWEDSDVDLTKDNPKLANLP